MSKCLEISTTDSQQQIVMLQVQVLGWKAHPTPRSPLTLQGKSVVWLRIYL